ncbi:agmatine deiminase family protein [Dysgonomonas sp. 520]|uniref:agmatine deiminase family protein n=1 Tax=Dysgonomonas sp. 520 TaxID=2302931 RepID=UPI0013D4AD3E|nr:agmatine deiminase family protein [Dysgonomonas sp. 520]NDW10500.1 agmatine deiminase family protein [Dysgonomonas sp. 520]
MNNIFFPPEWYPQDAVMLTWPHKESDWHYMLDEITECFRKLAGEILKEQRLIVVAPDEKIVTDALKDIALSGNLQIVVLPSNDTWARDHAPVSVFINNKPVLYDFTFNGWGLKFAANYDNQINRGLFAKNIFETDVRYENKKNFVLEGGGIESDGKGTLLTTSECLLSPNRNPYLTKQEIEDYLISVFGLKRVLWLDHGYLAGDDTDSHIDTLARFCDEHTIAYVKCEDEADEHFGSLQKMEEQLKEFTDYQGQAYNLIPIPMADTVMEDGERLPATYANFLIMNKVVLMPTYNSPKDDIAKKQLEKAFPSRKIVGVDCLPIIKQHGSLHCVTMQFPKGFIKNKF